MKQFSIRSFVAWVLIWSIIIPFGITVKVILGVDLIWGIALFIPFVLISLFLILFGLNSFPSKTKNEMELLAGLICAIALSLTSIMVYHGVDQGGTGQPILRAR